MYWDESHGEVPHSKPSRASPAISNDYFANKLPRFSWNQLTLLAVHSSGKIAPGNMRAFEFKTVVLRCRATGAIPAVIRGGEVQKTKFRKQKATKQ
jgi:hypothetical protein